MSFLTRHSAYQAASSVSAILPRAGPAISSSSSSLSTRYASHLSAIHQGLRNSGRAGGGGGRRRRDGGDGPSPRHGYDRSPPTNPQRPTFKERQRILAERSSPDLRIRRGKKDITERAIPRSPSRRARFNSPEYSFGKDSLVYQARNGKYRGLMREIDEEEKERAKRLPVLPYGFARRGEKPAGVPKDRTPFEWEHDDWAQQQQQQKGSWDGGEAAWKQLVHQKNPEPPRNNKRDAPIWKTRPERTFERATAASQYLYGASVVEAALRTPRRQLYRLFVFDDRVGTRDEYKSETARNIEKLARQRRVEVVGLDPAEAHLLDKWSEDRPHNGYVLEASPLPQLPVISLGPVVAPAGEGEDTEDTEAPGFKVMLRHQSVEEAQVNGTSDFLKTSGTGEGTATLKHKPFVLVLDQIEDPGNLGAVLRTAAFLGARFVALTTRNSARVTPVALKASAGAAEELTLLSVRNLGTFLTDSRAHGWHVYAAVPPPPKADAAANRRLTDIDEVADEDPLADHPTILVIGNEGHGVAPTVRRQADYEVSIPNVSGTANVDSLNVSVAAGLLLSAFLKGRTREMLKIKDKARLEHKLFTMRMNME